MPKDGLQNQGTTRREVLTIRLDHDLAQGLREYKFFAQKASVNDVVAGLIRDFLAGPGREEIARGMTRRAREMYGPALDKLADM